MQSDIRTKPASKVEADRRDLQAELDSRREGFEEAIKSSANEDDKDRQYCSSCHEPIDECQCNPDDHDDESDEI